MKKKQEGEQRMSESTIVLAKVDGKPRELTVVVAQTISKGTNAPI